MTVNEQLMGIGSWSLKLRDDTPQSVLDDLDPINVGWVGRSASSLFSHIIITPTRIDPNAVDPMTVARYTGILRNRPSYHEMNGPGLAAWLADENHKGDILETAVAKTAGTFVQWITDLKPSSLTAGTYNVVAGTLSHTFLLIDRRTALDYVCDYFGAEWKVTADGKLHGGTQAQLFVKTPKVVVQRRDAGRDLTITGIRAELDKSSDGDDYANRVVLVASGAGAAAAVGAAGIGIAESRMDLNGNRVVMTQLVDSPDTQAGNESAVATAQLNQLLPLRRAVTLSSDAFDIGGDIAVGDTIHVWDDQLSLYDLTNPIAYRGELIYPIKLRVVGYTWPVREGMGVYLRSSDGTATILDLTDWIEWENADTSVDVGALPRSIDDQTNPASLQRTASLGPQGSIGYGSDTSAHLGVTTQYPALIAVPGTAVSVTVGPNRRLRATGHLLINTSGANIGFVGAICEGGVEIGRFGQDNLLSSFGLFEGSLVIRSPSVGTHTYELRVARVAAAGSIDVRSDSHGGWIDIIDEGPDF